MVGEAQLQVENQIYREGEAPPRNPAVMGKKEVRGRKLIFLQKEKK